MRGRACPFAGNESDTKFLSHYAAERLPAEVLLDAIAQVTGVPTPSQAIPAGWRSQQLPDVKPESTFLDAFGRPVRESTCSCERSAEPSMAQALSLLNGGVLNGKLRSDQGTVAKAIASNASRRRRSLTASSLPPFTRPATSAERERIKASLAEAVAGIKDPKEASQPLGARPSRTSTGRR